MTHSLLARSVALRELPIIDITGLENADMHRLRELALQVKAACQDKGFFYITGHGIETSVQETLLEQAKRFFSLSDDEKRKVSKYLSPVNRGYEPLGNQTLEAGAAPDLKEGFYIGPELPAEHPLVKAGKFNFGANQWPESLPEFKSVTLKYIDDLATLATRLMGLIALSLDLHHDYFAHFCRDPLMVLRMLHYPPQPANPRPGEKGCGAHTDFGGLTLLLQDKNGGLQVWDHECGEWLQAAPIPGSFIVNLGDMIARWTNDHYKSTLHRVINISGAARYSVPFFFSGNPDHQVACLTQCLTPGEEAKYPPTTVEDHLKNMYKKTYG